MRRAILLLLLLSLACKRSSPSATGTDASVAYGPSAAPIAEAEASALVDAGTTGVDPYAEVPSFDTSSGIMLPERIVGFSKDDRYLGYEISTCDPCPSEFHFIGTNGQPPISMHYFYDPRLDQDVADKRRKIEDGEVDKKLATLGATPANLGNKLRGPFPYGDLVFAAKDSRDDAGRVTLLVGAHMPGEEPVFPMRIELGMHPMRSRTKSKAELESFDFHEAQLAYINVTHDGREIGAVAEVSGTMWFESGGVARMPTASFAAQVYNDTAMRKLTKNDNRVAADLFAKAEAANPESAVHSYNLACAAARSRDSARAEPALARAIKKSAVYRERARSDHDFDSVRTDAWFVTLTQ